MKIELDFTNHKDLFNEIGKLARADFRSVRGQIMAILTEVAAKQQRKKPTVKRLLQLKKKCDACGCVLGKNRYYLENGDIVCNDCYRLDRNDAADASQNAGDTLNAASVVRIGGSQK